ncbi:Iron permease FTR1 [Mycena indigotica]|uniref:Iron permease FTR1 n=1 Tax=Mycena indigotica TaxID=2126181 RepID=A0A8H6VS71_9AGAR|nr:Iron permease FTR1 [Mycena indigotica]KAF7291854.1 Iron permease FTR1 [Mycena indigotica]
MGKNLFSIPIFFIVFRETLEASIIVSVLLGLAEQIVYEGPGRLANTAPSHASSDDSKEEVTTNDPEDDPAQRRAIIRKLRIQIFAGAALGLLLALAIGAAFIAVWFTQASDLWAKSEALWEGIFMLIASLMIFVMGVTMLRMDRAKAKWRVKLERAFSKKAHTDGSTKVGRWALFVLPLITVLREGMEAVVFVGGVSLGQPATSIPIATIVGLICGLIIGFLVYTFASRTTLTIFLVAMTNLLLLIGAGLFSRAVWAFEENAFNKLLGADVDDAGGNGPGSFRVQGNVWHLNCCNPEDNLDGQGWSVFNALFGWTNSASLGSVLSYVFYWLAVIVTLVVMKFREGRTTMFGKESEAGARRRIARERTAAAAAEQSVTEESK